MYWRPRFNMFLMRNQKWGTLQESACRLQISEIQELTYLNINPKYDATKIAELASRNVKWQKCLGRQSLITALKVSLLNIAFFQKESQNVVKWEGHLYFEHRKTESKSKFRMFEGGNKWVSKTMNKQRVRTYIFLNDDITSESRLIYHSSNIIYEPKWLNSREVVTALALRRQEPQKCLMCTNYRAWQCSTHSSSNKKILKLYHKLQKSVFNIGDALKTAKQTYVPRYIAADLWRVPHVSDYLKNVFTLMAVIFGFGKRAIQSKKRLKLIKNDHLIKHYLSKAFN